MRSSPLAELVLRGVLLVGTAALLIGCHDADRASDASQAQRGVAAIRGIAQDGFTLGRPDAPWTLSVISSVTSYELDQLITQLPDVTRPFVRSGRLKVQMRTPTSGPYATKAPNRTVAATLLAAGLQGRYWDALVRFVPSYRGTAEPDELAALLRRAGVRDVDRAMADRTSHRVEAALDAADAHATIVGAKGRILYLLTRGSRPARNLTGDADTARLGEGLARELASGAG